MLSLYAEFGKLNALEELDLSMCPRFTMTGMEGYRNVVGLSQNTKAIRFVMIEGCRGLAGSLLEKQYDTHPIRDDRGRIVQWCPV